MQSLARSLSFQILSNISANVQHLKRRLHLARGQMIGPIRLTLASQRFHQRSAMMWRPLLPTCPLILGKRRADRRSGRFIPTLRACETNT